MINDSNIGGMSGAPVNGPDDRKIGTVGQVFVDPETGMPNWITVHTGLFGRRESFVPLDGATWDNEVIRVAIDKDIIKDAPRIDAGEPLTPENEAALYRYYTAQATDAAGNGGDNGNDGVMPVAAHGSHEESPAPGRSRLQQYQRPNADTALAESRPDTGQGGMVDAESEQSAEAVGQPGVAADDPHAYTIEDAGTDANGTPDASTDASTHVATNPSTDASAGTGARAVPGATETGQQRGRHVRDD
ncbi:PRC-barrel domain-containing protein [Glaciibacter sp. 2TAF33]|uniref:PRC-barrel domain-containing protein n=1 Tax=Glaciibacter sp. 2TAF33 TaxID=3233015 RepID=UPI003F91F9A7